MMSPQQHLYNGLTHPADYFICTGMDSLIIRAASCATATVAGLWLGTENGTNRQRDQLDENIIPPLNWMNKWTYIKTNTENWNEIHNILRHSFSVFIFSTCNNITIIFAFTTVNCIYATYSTKMTMYEKYTINRCIKLNRCQNKYEIQSTPDHS